MEKIWQDLRYAARMLAKKPGFTAIAILTIALGIGANTVIFSVVNGVLLKPLPYAHADHLLVAWEKGSDGKPTNTTYATYVDWKARSQSFDELAIFKNWQPTLTGGGTPELVPALRVTDNFFRLLEQRPALGRDFLPGEDVPAKSQVVILSHGLWERRFGADPAVIGRTIALSGKPYTVVGVMPANFQDLVSENLRTKADLWAPLGYDLSMPWSCRTCHHITAIARLKPGVSLTQAGAEMNTISENLFREHPTEYSNGGVLLVPMQDQFVGPIRPLLLLLLGAVGFVLLIACANVANLLLARATQRRREFAIRATLGASGGRIVRQLLTESVLLSLAGAALGCLLAVWGLAAVKSLRPGTLPLLNAVTMDFRVLAFALAAALLTGLLFGIAPALVGSRLRLNEELKLGGHVVGAGPHRLRGLLVITQLAMAVILLAGTGLLLRSFLRLVRVSPGFEPQHLLTMNVSVAGPQYVSDSKGSDTPPVSAFEDEVLRRVHAVPGVESAAFASQIPLGGNRDTYGFHAQDKPLANPEDAPSADRYCVTPEYFSAMRVPLLRGRTFTEADSAQAPPVMLVDETLARSIWPGESPIGKRAQVGGQGWRTIIGVVGEVHHVSLEGPARLQFYLPQAQWTDSSLVLAVRAKVDPASLTASVRDAVWSVDKQQPIFGVATGEELLTQSVSQRELTLALLGVFAALAILMAGIGTFGVMSYNVSQRTNEIGIRMALGAQAGHVQQLVVRQGMQMVVAGLAFGMAGALVLTRFLATMLFAVRPADPLTFAGVAVVLSAAGFLACYLPARRATRVDPLTALRNE